MMDYDRQIQLRWTALIGLGAAAMALLILASLLTGGTPDFKLIAVEGGVVSPTSHDTMVLQFWITGCGPCKHQMRAFARYREQHPEVPLYGVNANGLEMERLRVASARTAANYPILQGNRRLASQFGVSAYPTTVILRHGEVVTSKVGSFGGRELERMLETVQ